MSKLRRCPVCFQLKIRRPENHTCGARECTQQWKEWSRGERERYVRNAELGLMAVIPDSWKPTDPDGVEANYEKENLAERQEKVTMPSALANLYKAPLKQEDEVCKEHGKAMCFICSGILKVKDEKNEKEDS